MKTFALKIFVTCAIIFIMMIAAGALVAASNKVSISQILGPGASTTGKLFGWLVNGNPAFLGIGTNLSIDSSGNLNAASETIPATAFVDNALLGQGTGTQTSFALPSVPNPTSSMSIFVMGVKALPGAGNDYTVAVSGTTASVVFTVAPAAGLNIEASYRTAGF